MNDSVESSEEPDTREVIHKAVQESLHYDDARETQGNVITGWVIVVESMDSRGNRWLSRISSDPNFKELSTWTRKGFLHDALFDNEIAWMGPSGDEDDSKDDD